MLFHLFTVPRILLWTCPPSLSRRGNQRSSSSGGNVVSLTVEGKKQLFTHRHITPVNPKTAEKVCWYGDWLPINKQTHFSSSQTNQVAQLLQDGTYLWPRPKLIAPAHFQIQQHWNVCHCSLHRWEQVVTEHMWQTWESLEMLQRNICCRGKPRLQFVLTHHDGQQRIVWSTLQKLFHEKNKTVPKAKETQHSTNKVYLLKWPVSAYAV